MLVSISSSIAKVLKLKRNQVTLLTGNYLLAKRKQAPAHKMRGKRSVDDWGKIKLREALKQKALSVRFVSDQECTQSYVIHLHISSLLIRISQ
jgi:hypothetical protein